MGRIIGSYAGLLATLLLVTLGAGGAAAGQARPRPATPFEPIAAILLAFERHAIVAVGDPHDNEQAHEFRLSLIRDPRFAAAVDDIVVEWGNALYQDVMDRFVDGDDVPDAELRQVWWNTTHPGLGNDRPITEAFFRAVREVNAPLPPERRLRVLLGDPPIDWDAVESREDHQKWIELRDTHAAALIRREAIGKGRRALVVYGSMHLQRRNLFSNYELVEDPNLHTLVQQLEREGDARVFTVWPTAWPTAGVDLQEAQPDVASWRAPSLALVRGTVLGAVDFSAFYPAEVPRATIRDGRIVTSRDGRIVPVSREEWRSLPAEDQFDAVLYLGPPSGMTRSLLSPALCRDPAYMDMRRERLSLVEMQRNLEQLQRYCARVAP